MVKISSEYSIPIQTQPQREKAQEKAPSLSAPLT